MQKIKKAKRKHRIENTIVKIVIWVAAVAVITIIVGLAFGAYLCWKFNV